LEKAMPESKNVEDKDVGLLLKALRFASEKHRHQRRKDKEKSPYINHPIEVAERIWNVGNYQDINTICAALLHDTVEDTDATFEEIDVAFGPTIGAMVREVTDDKSLPKARRKELQIEHTPHLSQGAKHIKLGDKTSNIKDIYQSPPPDWSHERRCDYLSWTEKVVGTIRGTNEAMEADYYRLLAEARKSMEKSEV
jgi:GTP diphosphokinase / guanosine-3',5'-bis(diphosphate) 3'-diphosphatase